MMSAMYPKRITKNPIAFEAVALRPVHIRENKLFSQPFIFLFILTSMNVEIYSHRIYSHRFTVR